MKLFVRPLSLFSHWLKFNSPAEWWREEKIERNEKLFLNLKWPFASKGSIKGRKMTERLLEGEVAVKFDKIKSN
jgi:hypothetical protein